MLTLATIRRALASAREAVSEALSLLALAVLGQPKRALAACSEERRACGTCGAEKRVIDVYCWQWNKCCSGYCICYSHSYCDYC